MFFLLEVTRTVISGETSHLVHCVHNQEREESPTAPSVLGPLLYPLAGGPSWGSEEDLLLLNCSKSYLIPSHLGPVPWSMAPACRHGVFALTLLPNRDVNQYSSPWRHQPTKMRGEGKGEVSGGTQITWQSPRFSKTNGNVYIQSYQNPQSFHMLTSLYHQMRDWKRSEEICLLNRFQSLSHRMWLSQRDHKPNQRPRCALTHSYSKPGDVNLGVTAPVVFYLCHCW